MIDRQQPIMGACILNKRYRKKKQSIDKVGKNQAYHQKNAYIIQMLIRPL